MSSYSSPSPTRGLNLKSLPPWAWGVAIAGGAIVGFVLLKPGQGQGQSAEAREEGEGGEGGAGAGRTSGETAVVQPITEDVLQALGLTPGFQIQGYTDGAGSTFSGDGSGGDGSGGDGTSPAQSFDVSPAPWSTTQPTGTVQIGSHKRDTGDPTGKATGPGYPSALAATSYDSGAVYKPGSSTPLPAGTLPRGGQVLAQ